MINKCLLVAIKNVGGGDGRHELYTRSIKVRYDSSS